MNINSSVDNFGDSSAFSGDENTLSTVTNKGRNFNWQKLTKILRWTGATLLLVSAFIFLCQGLAGLSSMGKYRIFLGFTALLGGVGIFCGKKWKEDKGARTFLGLATAMVAVNFAQLGAFLFFQFNGSPKSLPDFFILQYSDKAALLLTGISAVFLLAPVTFFGFSALVRKLALPLSIAYFLSCISLLLPFRAEMVMALVFFFQIVTLLILERKQLRHEMHMSTFDGWLVRGILLLPVLVIASRTILYPIEYLFYSTCLAAVGTILFFFLPCYLSSKTGKKVCNALSMCCFGGAWLLMTNGLSHDLNWAVLRNYQLLINYLPFAVLIIAFSFVNPEDGSRKRMVGSFIALGVSLAQLFPARDLWSAFICLLVSATLLVFGCAMEERALLFAGLIGVMAGLGKYIHYALNYYSLAPWLSLAIAGALVVLLSSYIERYRHRDLGKLSSFRSKLENWN